MDEQVGGRAVIDSIRENMPQLREALRELPGAIRALSEQASTGNLKMRVHSDELDELRAEIRSQHRQRFWLGAGATGAIAGTLLIALEAVPWLGWMALLAGAVGLYLARPGRS